MSTRNNHPLFSEENLSDEDKPLVQSILYDRLNDLEIAKLLYRLRWERNYSFVDLSKFLHLSIPTVYQYMAILKMPQEIQDLVQSGKLLHSDIVRLSCRSIRPDDMVHLARAAAAVAPSKRALEAAKQTVAIRAILAARNRETRIKNEAEQESVEIVAEKKEPTRPKTATKTRAPVTSLRSTVASRKKSASTGPVSKSGATGTAVKRPANTAVKRAPAKRRTSGSKDQYLPLDHPSVEELEKLLRQVTIEIERHAQGRFGCVTCQRLIKDRFAPLWEYMSYQHPNQEVSN